MGKRSASHRTVQPLRIFGAPQHASRQLVQGVIGRIGLGRSRWLDRSRRQAQAGENDRETEAGRLPERALQKNEKTGAEEKERQRIPRSDLTHGKEAELAGERG